MACLFDISVHRIQRAHKLKSWPFFIISFRLMTAKRNRLRRASPKSCRSTARGRPHLESYPSSRNKSTLTTRNLEWVKTIPAWKLSTRSLWPFYLRAETAWPSRPWNRQREQVWSLKLLWKLTNGKFSLGTFFQKAATRFKWNEIKIIGRGRSCLVRCVTHFSEFKAHLKAVYKNVHEMIIYLGLFLKNIGSVRSFWGAVFINLHFGELCGAFKTDESTSRTYLIDVLIGLQLLLVGAGKTLCRVFF